MTDLRWQLGFQWHRRGIELFFKSLDCFTKRLFPTATIFAGTYVFIVWNFTRLITRLKSFFIYFLTSIWWGSTQLQCIYYLRRILISRPPRVTRVFQTSFLWKLVQNMAVSIDAMDEQVLVSFELMIGVGGGGVLYFATSPLCLHMNSEPIMANEKCYSTRLFIWSVWH